MTILPKKSRPTPKERTEPRQQPTTASSSEQSTSQAASSSRTFYGHHEPSVGGEVVRKKMKADRAARVKNKAAASPSASVDGHNSGDENDRAFSDEELERRFEEHLQKAKGFNIKKMRGDGACLFRAVADQIYGDEEMHGTVRKLCMDYMAKNSDHFSQFVTEDFNEYLMRKRQDHVHGNHVEMQAIAEIFSRPIQVYEYSTEPINTFQPEGGKENPPLRLSYHGTTHYNSVVDPFGATIGVGLGLPGFIPGLAEKTLMHDAMRTSEAHAIEEAMLKDKISLTDWQATDQSLSEQIARESYLQFLREKEEQMKERNVPCHSGSLLKPKSPSRTKDPPSPAASSSVSGSSAVADAAPSCSSDTHRTDPDATATASASGGAPGETCSLMDGLPASAFGLTDWGDESDMLAQVLAMSQAEYLETLKANKSKDDQQPGSSSS